MVLIDMMWCILVTSITFRLAIGKDHMTSSGFFRRRVVQHNKTQVVVMELWKWRSQNNLNIESNDHI